ncbi:MAG: hypothetical protein WC476_08700 [Phycisphaerae bacterium]|jgi:hypothetical protein
MGKEHRIVLKQIRCMTDKCWKRAIKLWRGIGEKSLASEPTMTLVLNDYTMKIFATENRIVMNGPYPEKCKEIASNFSKLITNEDFQTLLATYTAAVKIDRLDKINELEPELIKLLCVPEELPTYYFELAGWRFSFKPPDIVEDVEGTGDEKLCQQIKQNFTKFAETQQGQQLLSEFLGIEEEEEEENCDSDEVTLKGKVLKTSEKAYFFAAIKNPHLDLPEECPPMWLPKSQITLKGKGELVMPYWLFNSRFSSIQKKVFDKQEQREKEIEAKLIRAIGIPSKTTLCDCCAKVDIPREDMTKIESGQLLCPECLKLLRDKS